MVGERLWTYLIVATMTSGIHCEEDINECDIRPCQHGGTCENLPGSYTCHCPVEGQEGIFYGGSNCTDILLGCTHHKCQNGGACFPQLQNGEHGYTCRCLPGYTGANCETTTTFSFDGRSLLHVPRTTDAETELFYNITLRFQTVQRTSLIFHRGTAETFLRLELRNGYLFVSLYVYTQLKALLHVAQNVSDGEWHAVEVTLTRAVTLKVLDSSCIEKCANASAATVASHPLTLAFQSTFFGGFPAGGVSDEPDLRTDNGQPESWLVGCLRDIHIDSSVTTPLAISTERSLNVKTGCHREERCGSRPCQNRGRCVNLWLGYQCDCHRPYEGPDCSREYTAGRFGQEGSRGHASFFVGEIENVTISMFVRTRKSVGALLALKNSTSVYLRICLEQGRLALSTHNNLKLLSEHQVNDGDFHLISLKIEQNQAELIQASQNLGRASIPVHGVHDNYTLYIGGLPDQQETDQNGGYFKGCIQDVRLNSTRLEFFPLSSSEESTNQRLLFNVTRGCSSDNLCKPNPCQNGGVCYSLWDDFTCTCPPNTAGRACEEVKWCELSPCPSETRCQPVPRGFECVTHAAFNGKNSIISYRSNGKITRDLTNVTFGFRTRDTEVVLLHAEKEPEFITIGIRNSKLLLQLQSGNSIYVLSLASPQRVNDGRWHRATLSMTDPLSQSSRWRMELDGQKDLVTSSVSTGNLNFLREDTDIYLGDRDSVDAAGLTGCLAGCLSTVELGGIHLPYIENSALHQKKPQDEQFLKTSPSPVTTGCLQTDGCESDPCLHRGACEDLYSAYRCTCPKGWAGTHCETNLDECLSNPCVHGNCSDRINSYVCRCERGYTGVHCERNVNNCLGHQCPNGATCIDGINSYTCVCPGNFTGRFCKHSRLPTSVCGNEKKNLTCFNYGNCTETKNDLHCNCLPGFMGERCEIDLDECQSDPCLNGGLCQNLPNRFQCICDISFAGERCEIDTAARRTAVGLAYVIAPCVTGGAIVLGIVTVLIIVKFLELRRAEGQFNPRGMEQTAPQVEMAYSVPKVPPEERLI